MKLTLPRLPKANLRFSQMTRREKYTVLTFLFLLLAIPLTIILLRRVQDLRRGAEEDENGRIVINSDNPSTTDPHVQLALTPPDLPEPEVHKVYLPAVYKNFEGQTSSIVVENTGNSALEYSPCDVTYYNRDGSLVDFPCTTAPLALAPHAAHRQDLSGFPSEYMPDGFDGSAAVSAAGDISVLVETTHADGAYVYRGIEVDPDSDQTLYLPLYANEYRDQNTTLTVQNTGAAAASQITAHFYNQEGDEVYTKTFSNVAPNASFSITPDQLTTAANPLAGAVLGTVNPDLSRFSLIVKSPPEDNVGYLALAYNSNEEEYLLVYEKEGGLYLRKYDQAGNLKPGQRTVLVEGVGGQLESALAFNPVSDEYLLVWNQGGQFWYWFIQGSGQPRPQGPSPLNLTKTLVSSPSLVYVPQTGDSGFYNFLYEDQGRGKMYAQRLRADATTYTETEYFPPDGGQDDPALALADSNNFYPVWEQADGKLYSGVLGSGNRLTRVNTDPLALGEGTQTNPLLVYDTSRDWTLLLYSDDENSAGSAVNALRITTDGVIDTVEEPVVTGLDGAVELAGAHDPDSRRSLIIINESLDEGPPPTNQPPEVDPIDDQQICAERLFEYDVNAADPNPGDTLTYVLGCDTPSLPGCADVVIPDNMSIGSGSGRISWTPRLDQVGLWHLAVQANDGQSGDTELFDVTVTDCAAPPPPANEFYSVIIESADSAIAAVGVTHRPASSQYAAANGSGFYAYEAFNGDQTGQSLYFSSFINGGEFASVLAVQNISATPATFRVTSTGGGTPLVLDLPVPGHGMALIDSGGQSLNDGLRLVGNRPAAAIVNTVRPETEGRRFGAYNGSHRVGGQFDLPLLKAGESEIFVQNTSSEPADVTLNLYDENGVLLDALTEFVAPQETVSFEPAVGQVGKVIGFDSYSGTYQNLNVSAKVGSGSYNASLSPVSSQEQKLQVVISNDPLVAANPNEADWIDFDDTNFAISEGLGVTDWDLIPLPEGATQGETRTVFARFRFSPSDVREVISDDILLLPLVGQGEMDGFLLNENQQPIAETLTANVEISGPSSATVPFDPDSHFYATAAEALDEGLYEASVIVPVGYEPVGAAYGDNANDGNPNAPSNCQVNVDPSCGSLTLTDDQIVVHDVNVSAGFITHLSFLIRETPPPPHLQTVTINPREAFVAVNDVFDQNHGYVLDDNIAAGADYGFAAQAYDGDQDGDGQDDPLDEGITYTWEIKIPRTTTPADDSTVEPHPDNQQHAVFTAGAKVGEIMVKVTASQTLGDGNTLTASATALVYVRDRLSPKVCDGRINPQDPTVTVNPGTVPDKAFTFALSDVGSENFSYEWQALDGGTVNPDDERETIWTGPAAADDADYNVKVTATDKKIPESWCSDQTSVIVDVTDFAVSITPPSDEVLVGGTTTTFIAEAKLNGVNVEAAYTWQLLPNSQGQLIGSLTNPSDPQTNAVATNRVGTNTLQVTAAYQGRTATADATVTAVDYLSCSITTSPDPLNLTAGGVGRLEVNHTPNLSGKTYSYAWSATGGAFDSQSAKSVSWTMPATAAEGQQFIISAQVTEINGLTRTCETPATVTATTVPSGITLNLFFTYQARRDGVQNDPLTDRFLHNKVRLMLMDTAAGTQIYDNDSITAVSDGKNGSATVTVSGLPLGTPLRGFLRGAQHTRRAATETITIGPGTGSYRLNFGTLPVGDFGPTDGRGRDNIIQALDNTNWNDEVHGNIRTVELNQQFDTFGDINLDLILNAIDYSFYSHNVFQEIVGDECAVCSDGRRNQ